MDRRWIVVGLGALLIVAAVAGYLVPSTVVAAQNQAAVTSTSHVGLGDGPTPTPRPKSARPKPTRPTAKEGALLGVTVASVDGAARVEIVLPGSPAAQADLKRGDKITGVDGQAVANAQQLVERIAQHRPGDKVTLAIQRGDSSLSVEVTLGQRLGVRVAPQPAPKLPNLPDVLGRLLPELRGMAPAERFDHLRGGTFSFTDRDGKQLTVEFVAGIVTAATTDAIKIRPNGQSSEVTYLIDDQTKILPGDRAKAAETLQSGDRVLALGRRDGSQTRALVIHDQTAIGRKLAAPQQDKSNEVPHKNLRPKMPDALRDQLQRRMDDIKQRLKQLP